jgi:uncharacterized protein (TIGR02996 family)
MTAQAPDWLISKGERVALCANPLEQWFADDRPRPPFRSPHTANWRGYVATWELSDDALFLVGLDAWLAGGEGPTGRRGGDPDWYDRGNASLEDVFPGHGGRIAATWFTGELRVPRGELLQYVHMAYASEYERDLLLVLHRGRLVLSEEFDNQTRTLLHSELGRRPDFLSAEEWAFVQSARETPDDPAPLLVYADWLEERGQDRGGVLRQLAALSGTEDLDAGLRERLTVLQDEPDGWLWLRLLGRQRCRFPHSRF